MNHIKTLLCIGFAATLGATAWVATPTDAEARSQSGMLGSARLLADAGCFEEANGGPHQKFCAGTKSWVIPIVVDNAGWQYIKVMAKGSGNGVNKVGCRAWSFNSSGGVTPGSFDDTELNTNVWEPLDISVYAQGWGGTFVMCSMAPDTRILHVNYNGTVP